MQRTNPEKERKKGPLLSSSDVMTKGIPLHRDQDFSNLEGIALRRNLGYEPKNRQGKKVYIEAEFLQVLDRSDLNFQVNLALEHMLTKHPSARLAVQGLDE